MEPERDEGERTLDEQVRDDARRDGADRTGGASGPASLAGVDRTGYDPGPDVAGLRPIPRPLADELRRRLAECQDMTVDGDLAHGLSLTAVLCAWLAASLHVDDPAVETDPFMARARKRFEDAMGDAPVRRRLDETNGVLKRMSTTLARLAQGVDDNGDAIGASLLLAGYTAAWQADPGQAVADHIDRKRMVDVTWPQALHAVERAKAIAQRDGTGRARRGGDVPVKPASRRQQPATRYAAANTSQPAQPVQSAQRTPQSTQQASRPAQPAQRTQSQPRPARQTPQPARQTSQPARQTSQPARQTSQPAQRTQQRSQSAKRQPTFDEMLHAHDDE